MNIRSYHYTGVILALLGGYLKFSLDSSWGIFGIILGILVFTKGWKSINLTEGHYIAPECRHCIAKSLFGLVILMFIPIPFWLIEEEGILVMLSEIFAITCFIWGINWLTSYYDCISNLPAGGSDKDGSP